MNFLHLFILASNQELLFNYLPFTIHCASNQALEFWSLGRLASWFRMCTQSVTLLRLRIGKGAWFELMVSNIHEAQEWEIIK